MDRALASPLEVVRHGALVQIAAARVVLATLAVMLLATGLFGSRIATTTRYQIFVADRRPILASIRSYRRRLFTPSFAVMGVAVALMITYFLIGDRVLSSAEIHAINREDGILENFQVICLGLAALVSLWVALRLGRRTPEFYMHWVLAAGFFVMCGEEISWGQRLLGLETPVFLAEVNVQNEINFHNLYGYVFDNIVILFVLTWGVCVPLLDRIPFLSRVFESVGLPVASSGLAVGIFAALPFENGLVGRVLTAPGTLRISEARETLSALGFLVLMLEVWFLVAARRPAPWQSAASGRDRSPLSSGSR